MGAEIRGLDFKKLRVHARCIYAFTGLAPMIESKDPEERRHALHYTARSYSMLKKWDEAIVAASRTSVEFPEDAANWLTLIGSVERKDGLLACGEDIHRAMKAHPYFRELRWWAARWHVAVMADLAAKPDPYSMVPTRGSRYLPHFAAALPFFMMHIEREEPAPKRVIAP